MRFLGLLAMLAIGSNSVQATEPVGWLRYPAISWDGRHIAFAYKGDLYRVPAEGGRAVQLTTSDAQEAMPVWSHDGKWIAFASDRNGSFDAFVMPAEGGPARRLTSHSAPEWPSAFSHDDRYVLFSASRGTASDSRAFPHEELPQLYRVPTQAGPVELVLSTPTEAATESPNGRWLAYHDKKGVENPWRKHHKSSIARDVWVYDTAERTHRRVTDFPGEDRNPVISADGRALFFLSEASGSFNVFKVPFAGGAAVPLTSFTKHPVRFLTASRDDTLCYGRDGAIYTQAAGAAPKRVDITVVRDRGDDEELRLSLSNGVKEVSASPGGKELAFVLRGQIFVVPSEGGAARCVSQHAGPHRDVSFTPDGKALVYASERGGRWAIYEMRPTRPEEAAFSTASSLKEDLLHGSRNVCLQPLPSPDGKELAFIEGRDSLKVLDLGTRKVRDLVTSEALASTNDGDQFFRWSPDGKWIAFRLQPTGKAQTQVGLVKADGSGGVIDLTQSGFDCQNPSWILGGKALLFSSPRDGMRGLAAIGGTQTDWYAMFLDQATWDRFRLNPADLALLKESEGKSKLPPQPSDSLDFDRRADRVARLTIQSARMGDAVMSPDGESLFYLAKFEKGFNLWTTRFRTRETRLLTQLDATSANLSWDRENKNLLLVADGSLARIDPASGRREPVPVSCQITVKPAAERQAMFEHAARRVSETYFDRSFHGVDWDALCRDYARHVPHTGTSFEFAELLNELLGELNVSHAIAYLRSKDRDGDSTGSLGFIPDPAYRGPGVRVAEILANGPLDKADLTVGPGTLIESVDGEPIPVDRDWASLLNRKVGKRVLVGFRNGERRAEAVVRPISVQEESNLLYERWVRRNRAEVERLSGGRLGYVHIKNGFDRPFRTLVDEVHGRYVGRAGIVVDSRFNPGGSLTADLVAFLTGEPIFRTAVGGRVTAVESGGRWTGPSVLLVNEGAYSDGSCFSCSYQRLGVGKLVGMPVPGTCINSIAELLQDETTIFSAPVVKVTDPSGALMEGRQIEPDVVVPNPYADVAAGRDPQLEAAVKVLLAGTVGEGGRR
jgi:tricorn protease